MMSPDAGSSDKVSTNRGFVFIPEVGDQVMVGFVFNHPDRPYVMGGLFHGGIGAGGQQQNHLKTITTRSGCIIQINDTENEGSIFIKDPSGNTWFMDGNKNITVAAPETMTLNSKNMNINVQENMEISVGNDKTETIGNISTNLVHNKIYVKTPELYNDIMDKMKTVVINKMEEYAQIREIQVSGTTDIFSTGLISIKSGKGVDYGE